MSNEGLLHIGIDLGGTNIAAALVDKEGRIKNRISIPTATADGAAVIIRGLLKVCETLIDNEAAPASIGIGVPGMVDDAAGEVVFTPNLPLSGVNIIKELRRTYGCPVYIGNDANCAALGEAVAGSAKGARDVVFITLGTGIGGGIVLGGRLHTGVGGAAGELGHMVIIAAGRECGCGRKGCWEKYASASGLIKTSIEFMDTHTDSLLWSICEGSAERLNGRAVFDAYRARDRAAILAVETYIKHLSIGIANIINILEPEIFCVGGGISNAWDCIAEPLKEAVDAEKITRFSPNSPQTRIIRAELGNDAGIIGAAFLGVDH